MRKKKIRIFAFGGNEVAPVDLKDEKGNPIPADIPMQWQRTAETCKNIADIIEEFPEDNYIITHGNGPQVGNILLRAEHSLDILPPLPLDVCGADSQGAMGYMIGQLLRNELKSRNIDLSVDTIVTQVVVDKNDPNFKNPTKFIGPSYSKEEAEEKIKKSGWIMKLYKKDSSGREIWRRVVPSPKPLEVVELPLVITALENNIIPITVGGGGIPVILVEPDEMGVYNCNYNIKYKSSKKVLIYTGVEAVIDKDLASALLGKQIIKYYKEKGIDCEVTLTIFTAEDGAKINYQKPNEKSLRIVTVNELKKYYNEGHFPAGSMGPKIEALIDFIENGGDKGYISLTSKYKKTLKGEAGTTVIKG
jgi:carbamate kinase